MTDTYDWIEVAKGATNYEIAKEVMDDGPRRVKVGPKEYTLLDHFTASAMCGVYEFLREDQKKRFNALGFMASVNLTWKIHAHARQ